MSKPVFNTFYVINGRFVQFDDFLAMQKAEPVKPEPTPGPEPEPDPYNPLGLPPYTIRCKFKSGYTPTQGDSRVLVDEDDNIWDITKNSTNWSYLLAEEEDDYRLKGVLGANTVNVTNMAYLFKNCATLSSVSAFNTSSVVNMQGMFYNCSWLTSIQYLETSSVTDMSYMFYYCQDLPSVPHFNTASVKNMSYMFVNCATLTSIPQFNTESVEDMSWMFMNSRKLTTVPEFNTQSVTSMAYMFDYCEQLRQIPLFDVTSVTDVSSMYYNCTRVSTGLLDLYNALSSKPTVPVHQCTFYRCGNSTQSGGAELAQIPDDWKAQYPSSTP